MSKNRSKFLNALSLLKQGDWDAAHKLVQDDDSEEAAWVHGYLHKVEGDIGNAKYWYRQAGRKWRGDLGLEEELVEILNTLEGQS
jgi:hypothetical protein